LERGKKRDGYTSFGKMHGLAITSVMALSSPKSVDGGLSWSAPVAGGNQVPTVQAFTAIQLMVSEDGRGKP